MKKNIFYLLRSGSHSFLQGIGMLLLLVMISFWSSCRKDFEYVQSNGRLGFSTDTVFLDTVFNNIGSSTYSLKVYNRSDDDIEIPNIRLAQGSESGYRLNVDGAAGKEFQNIPLLAKDSLFIFIETTFAISQNDALTFLYTDDLIFDTGPNEQTVSLVTLVQDAVFIFPRTNADGTKESILLGLDAEGNQLRVEGVELAADQLNFTNEKPYVIYGYAAVPENETLEIDAGARVHFHQNSGLWVQNGATLKVNGAISSDTLLLENEVIFEGDRLEPELADTPGQWGTVWMANGSTDNEIDHLTIKNATVGLLVESGATGDTPALTLRNSKVYNASSVNLWARNSAIVAENMVFGSAGNISVYCNLGGNYRFTHTTIANYWSRGFRGGEALRIDNEIELASGERFTGNLVNATFENSIIDGSSLLELALIDNGQNDFNFLFDHTYIRFDDISGQLSGLPVYDFENTARYNSVLLNENIPYKGTDQNDFRLLENAPIIGIGSTSAALIVPFDILGIDRTTAPDLGAFQFVPIP
ncbi:hypothetical protein [Maribacter sp. 2-571]|uniref:hypothetical protein n=1 Tax=Maribacter sp. 2-571 TaxID=3417569 RepID=UPI003D33D087